MILALIFAAMAVLFACWLLFTLATLALPLFAAVTVGMWVHSEGGGYPGAIILGLAAGVVTLLAGQLLFATARSPVTRLVIGVLFAVPAGIAGYHGVYGFLGIGVDSDGLRRALAIIGALVIGGTAWARTAGGGEVVRRIEQAAPSGG